MCVVRLVAVLACAAALGSCTRAQSYEVQGQIVAVDAARQELTIKHGDIKGFMPGMTMPFKVKDRSLMAGRAAGDLVRATLVIEESIGYLTSVEVTGRGPLTEPPPTRAAVDLVAPGESAPDVSLVDQDGQQRRLADWRGRALAVTFVYTRCPLPDFCPLMDRHFAAVQRSIEAEPALRDRAHLVSISIDPEFDTPAVLKAHAARAGARPDVWSYATGAADDLTQFGSRFGVAVMRDDPAAAEVLHNLRTAVIDRDGRLTTIFPGNEWSAADLTKEIRRAAGLE
jgi:protein SCO1/2